MRRDVAKYGAVAHYSVAESMGRRAAGLQRDSSCRNVHTSYEWMRAQMNCNIGFDKICLTLKFSVKISVHFE